MTLGRALLTIATAGGFALLLRTFLQGPVPLTFSLSAFVIYFLIAMLGVVHPQLGMYAPAVSRGPRNRGEVALTFDDGPHPEYTRKVLDLLDRAHAKATFFVIANKVEMHPDVAKEIVARGHALGIHGYDHDRFMTLRSATKIVKDLAHAIDVIEQVTGVRPWMFRPPVGLMSPRIGEAAKKLDLEIVVWSVRGRDGVARANANKVAARVATRVRPGAIVLLHDAAEHDDRVPAGVVALPRVLDAIAAKGLKSVRLDTWLSDDEKPAS